MLHTEHFTPVPVVVTTAWTTILEGETSAAKMLSLFLSSAAGQALSDLRLRVKNHANGTYIDFIAGAAGWTMDDPVFTKVTTGIGTLAAAATAQAIIVLGPQFSFLLEGKTAGGTATITAFATVA